MNILNIHELKFLLIHVLLYLSIVNLIAYISLKSVLIVDIGVNATEDAGIHPRQYLVSRGCSMLYPPKLCGIHNLFLLVSQKNVT